MSTFNNDDDDTWWPDDAFGVIGASSFERKAVKLAEQAIDMDAEIGQRLGPLEGLVRGWWLAGPDDVPAGRPNGAFLQMRGSNNDYLVHANEPHGGQTVLDLTMIGNDAWVPLLSSSLLDTRHGLNLVKYKRIYFRLQTDSYRVLAFVNTDPMLGDYFLMRYGAAVAERAEIGQLYAQLRIVGAYFSERDFLETTR